VSGGSEEVSSISLFADREKEAEVVDWTGISARRALPFGTRRGGALEYLVPDPERQLSILERRNVFPPY